MSLTNCSERGGRLELLRQVIVFLCVGGFATVLQYAVMFGLMYCAGLKPVRASAIGFVTSAVFNFALNARFTFKSERSVLQTAPRFAIVAATGLSLNSAVLAGLLTLHVIPFISQIVATLCVLSWNYIINAIWTFKTKSA